MSDQLPVLQILGGVDGDAGEGIEARRSTEEGIVPLGNVDAARIRVEAREYGIVEGRISDMAMITPGSAYTSR